MQKSNELPPLIYAADDQGAQRSARSDGATDGATDGAVQMSEENEESESEEEDEDDERVEAEESKVLVVEAAPIDISCMTIVEEAIKKELKT